MDPHLTLDQKLFIPSGNNSKFSGTELNFADYLIQTQDMITRSRVDLTADNMQKIVSLNSPFQWTPSNSSPIIPARYKCGVLLIHGLYDSPFATRDLATHFLQRGFLVRSVLLPGHATVPGDLLDMSYHEWIKAVNYAVAQLKMCVDQVYLTGYSLGGALALHYAARDQTLAGLILLAPALKLKQQNIVRLLPLLKLMNWATEVKWYKRAPQRDYVKYNSYPFNAAYQIYKLILEKNRLLQKQCLNVPLFMAITMTDELIYPQAAFDLFLTHTNQRSRMIVYGNPPPTDDPRISIRSSCFPEQNIIDFSHNAIIISPDNPHYGPNGDYKDFQHYSGNIPPAGKIVQGAILPKNLLRFVVQRLSYNPDFNGLMAMLDEFLG